MCVVKVMGTIYLCSQISLGTDYTKGGREVFYNWGKIKYLNGFHVCFLSFSQSKGQYRGGGLSSIK